VAGTPGWSGLILLGWPIFCCPHAWQHGRAYHRAFSAPEELVAYYAVMATSVDCGRLRDLWAGLQEWRAALGSKFPRKKLTEFTAVQKNGFWSVFVPALLPPRFPIRRS